MAEHLFKRVVGTWVHTEMKGLKAIVKEWNREQNDNITIYKGRLMMELVVIDDIEKFGMLQTIQNTQGSSIRA